MPLDDRNWVETKPEVFSLEGLIAWLEVQDKDKAYCYIDPDHCLMGQYCAHHGVEYPVLLNPEGIHERMEAVALWGEQTFGAALERARTLLAKEKANGRNCG